MTANLILNLEALYPACGFSVLLNPSRQILVYTLKWAKTTYFHILKFPFIVMSLCPKKAKNLNFSSLSPRRRWSSLYRSKKSRPMDEIQPLLAMNAKIQLPNCSRQAFKVL
jgi:hypothetical protein